MNDLQKSQIAGLARIILVLFGGYMAKKGISVDAPTLTDDLIVIAGALQVIAATVWSFMHKAAVAPAVAVAREVEAGTAFIKRSDVPSIPDMPKEIVPKLPVIGIILCLVAAAVGCKTTSTTIQTVNPDGTTNTVTTISTNTENKTVLLVATNAIKLGASFGAAYEIKQDGNALAYFELASAAITATINGKDYTPATLTRALNNISVSEIANNASLQLTINTIVSSYAVNYSSVVDSKLDQVLYLPAFLGAIRDGFNVAIAAALQ